VIAIRTGSNIFWWVFIINVPFAITYSLSDLAETAVILNSWTEIGDGKEMVVEFVK
jgi:hypothetical protein